MIDNEIQQETFAYYNERAEEHDLVYLGKGPALQQHAEEYKKDVAKISELASAFGVGRAIDIACGTGFWAPHYAPNCDHVTFFDQSESMLVESRKRIAPLDLKAEPQFIQGNFFEIDLPASGFDCALVGFLLSHFELEQEEAFFGKLNSILKPSAQLMVIDSAWSEKRVKHRKKVSIEERSLEDGRKFRVYKKYFDEAEIFDMLGKYGYSLKTTYFGAMFFAAIAERTA